MNTDITPKLIALVGGSGAGKTWLADRLCQAFGDEAMSLSLDDFYCNLSHLIVSERTKINFDHPNTIDWPLFESVLHKLQGGETVSVPRYDFVSHTRATGWETRSSRPFIIVEGLWLLWHPHVREIFDLRVFLDCVQSLRWQRRGTRDLTERARTTDAIREQFWKVVAPMHERYVEVQKPWADLVIDHSVTQSELGRLVATIRDLATEAVPLPVTVGLSQPTTPQVATLKSL